jgi:acetyl esterase/lipase
VKQAIAWIKASIAAHGGDPAFIAVTGGSAGGHLSALAALTPNDPAFQPGFEAADTTVQAAVPLYGVYDVADVRGTGHNGFIAWWEKYVMTTLRADDEATWYAASPVTRVGPHAPPFFVIHGAHDTLVPVEQARWFVEKLREASRNPVAYAELPYAQHGFDMVSSTRTHHALRAIERFLTVVRSHTGELAASAP